MEDTGKARLRERVLSEGHINRIFGPANGLTCALALLRLFSSVCREDVRPGADGVHAWHGLVRAITACVRAVDCARVCPQLSASHGVTVGGWEPITAARQRQPKGGRGKGMGRVNTGAHASDACGAR